ncbi:uncharacterized protein B0H64DRAFT_445799 [Chaetomium fimeti]|uniref:Uncharacterized protein n=1 Tax=Chaetomium fimeti TaxID=1854472 RepID=A0AAE0LP33_9PEZI|nr:hypothetical protein B0H64DRAFT_445799 [Chaetomium fimeti]
MYPMEGNGRPLHLQAGSYTAHARSSSRTSWDGVRVPQPSSRTPSQSPPQSPVRRSNRPRPASAISLPDHALGRPTALANRWSYDRERMPSPPPPARGSRPGTPLDDWEALEAAFSRPASTLIESRSSTRPPSILSASAELGGHSHSASTPTLRVHPPPPGDNPQPHPQQYPQEQQHHHPRPRQPYHLLTPQEMELLAHPPPLQPPMTASPHSPESPLPSPSPTPKHTNRQPQPQPYTTAKNDNNNNNDTTRNGTNEKESSCTNLCELTPARQVCGRFGAWVVGMAIPVTFAGVMGCMLGVCR